MTTFTKHFFNTSSEAEAFLNTTKGAYSISTVSKGFLHLGNWVVCVEVIEEEIITLPVMTETLKHCLRDARKQLESLGYIQTMQVMHSDVKTKYNFGTTFTKYNAADKTAIDFVLNVLTVNEVPKY